MNQQIEIGRLLRAGTTGFVAGCRVSQWDAPALGALVRAPISNGYQVYGLIHDIHIDDDGLVRQLVKSLRFLDKSVMDDAAISLVRNLGVLYPVFPTVALVLKSILDDLGDPAWHRRQLASTLGFGRPA